MPVLIKRKSKVELLEELRGVCPVWFHGEVSSRSYRALNRVELESLLLTICGTCWRPYHMCDVGTAE